MLCNYQTITLLKKLYAYSPETFEHCVRMTYAMNGLYQKFGLPDNCKEEILTGTLLHDIGKLNIPLSILHKNGVLNKEERNIINTHSMRGYEILSNFSGIVRTMAMLHHAKNMLVPNYCLALSVLDVCDALEHKRSYKKEMLVERVIEILEKENDDKTLSPEYVQIVIGVLRKEGTLDSFWNEKQISFNILCTGGTISLKTGII